MNNSIKIFENNQFGQIRSIENDGEPWFVATDVCQALDIQNVSQAVDRLDTDERSMLNIGRQGKANMVNEYGLYNLILASRKTEAKEFKRWITHEVIPSIRKTGSYKVPSVNEIDYKKLPSTNHAVSLLHKTFKIAGGNPISLGNMVVSLYRGIGVPVPALEAPSASMFLTASQIAERMGVLSSSGKPHGQVISGIIELLNVPEEMTQIMTFEQNGHSGTVVQYKPEVAIHVEKYLTDYDFPLNINLRGRNYQVQYRR